MRLRHRRSRLIVCAAALLVPGRVRRAMFVGLLGHDIHPTARIGRSLIDVDHLEMGEDASIGSLNLIRGCERVVLERRAMISSLNWINSVRRSPQYFQDSDRAPELILREGGLITYMHMIDACDRVELERNSTLAGFWSLVQTHAVDVDSGRQSSRPVRIGADTLVGSRCTLLPGAVVPGTSVVAAGAVVTGALHGPHIFGGVPARALRASDPAAGLFSAEKVNIR